MIPSDNKIKGIIGENLQHSHTLPEGKYLGDLFFVWSPTGKLLGLYAWMNGEYMDVNHPTTFMIEEVNEESSTSLAGLRHASTKVSGDDCCGSCSVCNRTYCAIRKREG